MKKRIISITVAFALTVALIACLAIASSAEAATAIPNAGVGEVIDVWLIAGQSNAIGEAKVENYPTDSAYAEYKELLTNGSSNVWYFGNNSTDFVPVKFGQGSNSKLSGSEIGIATALKNSANKNAVIKLAYGNTSLRNNTTSNESIKFGTWTPPTYIEEHSLNTAGNKTGDLYLSFISQVAEGLSKLKAAGYTPNLKGVWYMQGEADTLENTSTALYEELLTTLISDMRSDLSKITDVDCSELPFVYGRIHRRSDYSATTSLTRVQAAQDNVSKNTALKNVFMMNTQTDLVDPVTGQHRVPVQQDAWHYDTLSQQMIGEKFVNIASSEIRTLTKYGYMPANTSFNAFAVFKKSGEHYAFDSFKSSLNLAVGRATTLTNISGGVTDEAVILLLKNYSSRDYGNDVAKCGGTITLDLNGYTLTPQVTVFTTSFSDTTASKKTVFNVKNGTMLFSEFGIMYATGTTSVSQSFDLNVTDVDLGFFSGNNVTSAETFKYWDILVSNRSCNTSGGAKITVNVKVEDCTFDLVTNAHPKASIGTFKENNSNDNCYTDYNVTFSGCEFVLTSPTSLYGITSKSGDRIIFEKGEDGTYAKVILPEGNYTQKFEGIDDGYRSEAILRTRGETSGSNTVYYLTTGSDLQTAYGTIPSSYTNALAHPFVIFKKINGAYVFDSTTTTIKAAFERVIALTKLNGGVTDDAVILQRENVKDGTWPDNISDIAGTVTLDLAGHTLNSNVTLLRTDFDDDCVVNGVQRKTVVNIKNGSVGLSQFGVLYTTTNVGAYTVPKTLDLNFENVNFAFHSVVTTDGDYYKYKDILVSDRGNASGTPAYINVKAVDCTFDLMSGSKSIAVLGTLDGKDDKGNNHYNVEIIGGSILTDSFDKINCTMSSSADSLRFCKDSNGEYTKVFTKTGTNDPQNGVYREGENNHHVSFVDSGKVVDSFYKEYVLSEDVITKYGRIPATVTNFALFSKNEEGEYLFKSGYDTYANAMNAAIALTSATLESPDSEVVILLLHDWMGYTYPSGLSSIATTVTVDLDGHTLGAYESLGNTATGDVKNSNGETVKTGGTINYVNGNLILDYHPAVYIASSGTYTKGYQKTLNINFDNIYFGTSDIAKASALIGRVASNHTTEIATFNFKLTNCTFDMVTNRSSSSAFCIGNWKTSNDFTAVNLDFIDCDFIGLTEADFKHVITEGQDTVEYYKTNGNHYATLTLPKSASAPIGTYLADGKTSAFVKISETETDVTYALIPEDIINLDYAPLISITLSNDFIMNVYVPVNYTEEFTLDGKLYNKDNSYGGKTVQRDGKNYYHVTVPLGSSEAARSVKLIASVSSNDVTATATYTFSVLKYAEKIIKYSTSPEAEKTLMMDVLSYIKEAYLYFTSHNDASEIARVTEFIESVIGDYKSTPKTSGPSHGDIDGKVREVTLNLCAKPTIRFYVTDTDISFRSGTKELSVTVAEDGSYIELDVYAYSLCETVTFGNGGSYHISEFAKGCAGQAHEALVRSFICYVESAAAYRNYIISQQ